MRLPRGDGGQTGDRFGPPLQLQLRDAGKVARPVVVRIDL